MQKKACPGDKIQPKSIGDIFDFFDYQGQSPWLVFCEDEVTYWTSWTIFKENFRISSTSSAINKVKGTVNTELKTDSFGLGAASFGALLTKLGPGDFLRPLKNYFRIPGLISRMDLVENN